ERGAPGFSAHDIKGKFSLRASITSELVLEDVRVPAANLRPGAEGLGGPFSCLNQARYGIAWGALGAARTCYLTALRYAQDRRQFDRPIAGYQLVQQKLVHMVTEITKGQLLAWRLGRLKDANTIRPEQLSPAKRANDAAPPGIAPRDRGLAGPVGPPVLPLLRGAPRRAPLPPRPAPADAGRATQRRTRLRADQPLGRLRPSLRRDRRPRSADRPDTRRAVRLPPGHALDPRR